MKLAELLLQRAQLQSDLQDQASRVQENAQVLEGEEPNEKPDEILTGSLMTATRFAMSAAPACQPVWLCRDVATLLVGLSASVNPKLHTDNS